jgi:hypothetical protein
MSPCLSKKLKIHYNTGRAFFFCSLLKFVVIIYSSDVAEYEYDNQTASHIPILRERGLDLKTAFVIKISILLYNCNTQYQILNNIYMDGIITIKNN